MPPEGLQHRSHAGEPRAARVPDRLRKLPRYRAVDQRKIRPRGHGVPPDKLTHGPASCLRGLPYQQQLQPDQYGLLDMPPEGLQHGDYSD